MSINGEILIYDREEAYIQKLAEVILLRKEITMGVCVCSSKEVLSRMLEIGNIQILLISEEVPYEERAQMFSGTRIVLTRNRCKDLGSEEKELKKYQAATILTDEIVNILRIDLVSECRRNSQKRIVGIYSPLHRIGKTSFTLKLGKLLSERENVLYINLELYAGIGGYFKEEETDFSNLLYYARQDKDDMGERIAAMVRQKGNLDYIPPVKVWTDLRFMTSDDWRQFFDKIQKQSIYDTFLLDIGDAVSDVFEMLSICDRIIVPCSEGNYADVKLAQFRYMLTALNCQVLEDKITYVDFSQSVRKAAESTVEILMEERR